jgi:hypothetical protein
MIFEMVRKEILCSENLLDMLPRHIIYDIMKEIRQQSSPHKSRFASLIDEQSRNDSNAYRRSVSLAVVKEATQLG